MRATRECLGGAISGPQGTGKRTDEDGDGAHGSPHATQRGPNLADVRRAVRGRRSVPAGAPGLTMDIDLARATRTWNV
ncbi:hypothetical protein B296_00043712 [Ensete ventricosum]|uniref:Uncharacterized protein n=1 Tax=Ensete ventricosum TaxID=4639 RepID=A0A426X5I1_ENSVE|nr:hypothetical protein B296_00043712 [Ensete ventricosum]